MSNSISERSSKLYQILTGKVSRKEKYRLFEWEPLLDAFYALYDVLCSSDAQKKDKQVANFVKRFRSSVEELRGFRPTKDDFEILKTIGRGHFGEVHVVRERNTSDIYAMKILKKAATLSNDNVAFYEEERDVMAFAASPWVTSLQYAFQDPENLYLVMEFLPGGDLLNLLNKYEDSIMDENDARFYIAEIISAVHAVHVIGYVHRDIKPENILIDFTGHLKLADFGSAAKLINDNRVMCKMPVGTPEYIAPEVLQSMNTGGGFYGCECDWWSVGVVCYEMLCGILPFQADGILQLYSQIMNHKKSLSFPDDVTLSNNAENLIIGLLDDQKNRQGFKDLAIHPFFESLDWTTLLNTKPPFIPAVKDSTDTSHFEHLTASKICSTQPISPSLSNTVPFIGFTFTKSISTVDKEIKTSRINSINRTTSFEDNDKPSKLTQINEILNQNIDNLNKKLKEQESEFKKLEQEFNLVIKDNEKYSKIAAENDSKIYRLSLERDKLIESLESERNELLSINELRSNINLLNFELVTQGAKLEETLIDREGLKLRISTLQRDIDMYQNKITQYESKIKSMEKNLIQISTELMTSIDDLQQVMNASTLKFEEKTKEAYLEAKVYREKFEILEKNSSSFKKQESLELNHMNIKLLEYSENQTKLNSQIIDLREMIAAKEHELKACEALIIKHNQNTNNLENKIDQFKAIIKQLEANAQSYEIESTKMHNTIEELLNSKQSLVNSIEQKDKKNLELQDLLQKTDSVLLEEKKRSVEKIGVLQMNLNEDNDLIDKKNCEIASIQESYRQLDVLYKSSLIEINKTTSEIDRLNVIISAQKTSNFSLSQELELSNEKIKQLSQENEELHSCIMSMTSSQKEQLYKLESTIAQQTKLIMFLHTEVPKKKGARLSKAEPYVTVSPRSGKSARDGTERKDRDLEKQLEIERNQCLKLNAEITKLQNEIKQLKNSSTPKNTKDSKINQTMESEQSTIESLNDISSIGAIYEHVLNPIICYHPNICFICLRPINYSQITLKCSNCKIFFHSSCQNYLPSFSCTVMPVILNVENLLDYSLLYKIYPDLDSVKPILPFSGYLSILNVIGNNKFEWRKHIFEVNSSFLKIKNDDDDDDLGETGTIDFSNIKNACLIRSAVHTCDILFTPPSCVPFVFGIEINNSEMHNFNLFSKSKDSPFVQPTSQLGSNDPNSQFNNYSSNQSPSEYSILYLMAQSLDEKRLWVRLLNNLTCENQQDLPIYDQIACINTQLYSNITSIHPISDEIILFGHSNGLACARLQDKSIYSCLDQKIECHTLYQVENQIFGLFDKNRQLYRLVADKKTKYFSQASLKNKLKVSLSNIENFSDCFDINFGEIRKENIFLYFSKLTELYCLKLGIDGHYISYSKIPTGDVAISSLVINDRLAITCQEKFYIYDFENKSQKEFLCSEDHSLAFIVFGSNVESNYPMNIFITNRSDTPEFIICCSEFGVIVNKEGRRISGGDIRWDQIPLSFHYYSKTLVVCFPNIVELRNFDIENLTNINESTSSTCIKINLPIILTRGSLYLNEIIVSSLNINDYNLHVMKISLDKITGISGVSTSKKKSIGVTVSKTMSKKTADQSTVSTKRTGFLSRIIK